jgi:hypothetical protein
LGKAVKILSLNGLHPLNTGARVSFGKGKPTVTDGPFIESKEVLGGYWLVEADSKEELVKWAQRCPADEGDVIEIRQIFDSRTSPSRNRRHRQVMIIFHGESSRSVSENIRRNKMAINKESDKEQPKKHLAMKTPPIVSQQEWEGCAPAAPREGEGLDPRP